MSELERALRGAFAVDPVPAAPPGFEARMARAARERGRKVRAMPALLAAAVAGAAIATLVVGRRGDDRPATLAAPPPRGGNSVSEVWQLVVELRHRWRWSAADRRNQPPAPVEPTGPREPAREHRTEPRRPVEQVDCGDDPLCPLVAPKAARLNIAAAGGSARVTLDGQDAGNTPLEMDVIPGYHMIEVRWEDGREKKVFVTLRSGDHRSIQVSRPR